MFGKTLGAAYRAVAADVTLDNRIISVRNWPLTLAVTNSGPLIHDGVEYMLVE